MALVAHSVTAHSQVIDAQLINAQLIEAQDIENKARAAPAGFEIPQLISFEYENRDCRVRGSVDFRALANGERPTDCAAFANLVSRFGVRDTTQPDRGTSTSETNLAEQAGAAFITTTERPSNDRSIEWGALLADSTRFLLFQHAFRLATEKDTRAGLSGPFFRDYKDSVLNVHGWNDGDPFFVNYIDHPMEGSVAGFLEVAHDPRYSRTEIGKSSAYWKSRMRALAFSAAFSLEFEIGPLSEASIGNIQKSDAKAGVVDWVVTPAVGMAWMVGEDAIDKYLVKRWEASTNSHLTRILLRGVLNPSRSFANMMQGKVPWHRDTRPGVSHY